MLPIHRRRPQVAGAKPPAEVRFTELHVEPWPDGTRVRVHAGLTPFLEYPNLEVGLSDSAGREITRVDIIENVDDHIVFTLHIRTPTADGAYLLNAVIAYPEIGAVDQRSLPFTIQQNLGGEV
jgi:hypothetical protein